MISDNMLQKYPLTQWAFSYLKENFSLYSKTHTYILTNFDEDYLDFSEELLTILKDRSKTEEEYVSGLNEFIQLSREVILMQARLIQEGKYEHSSYKDRHEKVYQNKELMFAYMNGLLFSQVFWPNHYRFGRYFIDLSKETNSSSKILDVPIGDGIFTYYLAKYFEFNKLYAVDISPHAKEFSQEFLQHAKVNLDNVEIKVEDVFNYSNDMKFDFIACGELMEHIEHPDQLLKKLHQLLSDNGTLFLTTAIYSAAIDHIYLFNNVEEVRSMINEHFKIISELIIPTSLKEYHPEMNKESINYACVVKKNA